MSAAHAEITAMLLGRANYKNPRLLQILGGPKAMLESPLLKELITESTRAHILVVLAGRFGRQARALRPALKAIEDDRILKRLLGESGICPDLESFKKLIEP